MEYCRRIFRELSLFQWAYSFLDVRTDTDSYRATRTIGLWNIIMNWHVVKSILNSIDSINCALQIMTNLKTVCFVFPQPIFLLKIFETFCMFASSITIGSLRMFYIGILSDNDIKEKMKMQQKQKTKQKHWFEWEKKHSNVIKNTPLSNTCLYSAQLIHAINFRVYIIHRAFSQHFVLDQSSNKWMTHDKIRIQIVLYIINTHFYRTH